MEEDLAFQERSWRLQRLGWGLMLIASLAAVLGLFGSGPLSRASIGSETGGPLRLEYARFVRVDAPSVLRVRIAAVGPGRERGTASLWLNREYLERMRVEEVLPPPVAVEARGPEMHYTFAASGEPAPLSVTFRLRPTAAGLLRADIGLPRGPVVPFTQIVFP
ncbi:MAG: hypothetical protein L0027_16345 [Candidatus Rokubacteria bacterium]|nr:hypothetical protein [Candidatus Rokubacteria bacterium]